MKRIINILASVSLVFAISMIPQTVIAFSGSGTGTIGNPFVITDCVELQEMKDNLSAHYILGNDIDCADTLNWNTGKGFEPVGNGADDDTNEPENTPFTGTFDGNGHTISNLTIIRSNDTPNDYGSVEDEYYIGLFGMTQNAIVKDVRIVTSKIKGNTYVGGIIGYMNGGQLLDSSFNETTTPNECTPGHCVWARFGQYGGGLVGFLDGGEVADSHTAGSVRGSGSVIGGLVGYIQGGTLRDSYSTASADGGSFIGGLVGLMNDGTISKVYAMGSVHAVDDELPDRSGRELGGLIGAMSGGSITNAYATGAVNADFGNAGGFIGKIYGGTIDNSYSSGQVNSSQAVSWAKIGGFVGDVSTSGDVRIRNSFSVSDVNSTEAAGFAGQVEDFSSGPVTYDEPLVNVYYDASKSGFDFCYTLPVWGSGEGEFNYPQGIAVDSSNNVYVADYGNNRIQKLDSNGNYLDQWGGYGTGNGEFQGVYFIAIDSYDNVYVTDGDNHRIQKFDSNGNYLDQWGGYGTGNGEFQSPRGIDIDTAGNIYVVDNSNHRIQKFDSNGNYLDQWGANGTGNGEFQSPSGITLDTSNNVYVVDYGNHRIQKFDSNGNYLSRFGVWGTTDGAFQYPQGIDIDTAGNIYVVDNSNHRIQKFDSNGNYLDQWGTQGSDDGEFNYPQGVAIDSSASVYIADTNNHRIQKFDSSGAFLGVWRGSENGNQGCMKINENSTQINYFQNYQNAPFTVSGSRVWSNTVWSFDGLSYPVFCNGTCQSILPSEADGDNDGIGNSIEHAAPNDGDGNADGIADSDQSNVTSFVSSQTNTYVTLVAPNGTTFSSPSTQSAPNTKEEFPFGLFGFTLSGVSTGGTVQIEALTPSDKNPTTLKARKYLPASQSYIDIPNPAITTVSIGSQATIKLVFNITDGSVLDVDGQINGSITDPVGLAVQGSNDGLLANTGERLYVFIAAAAMLIGFSFVINNRLREKFVKYRQK